MHHSRKQRHRHEYGLKDYIRLKMKGGTGTGFYPHKVGGTKKRNGCKKYRKTMNRRR